MTRPTDGPAPGAACAYFLDFDGTLVDIAQSPVAVRANGRLRKIIESLRASSGGAVALITGRAVADIDRIFPGIRLAVAGQHGIERRTVQGRTIRHPFSARRLDPARRALAAAAARHAGLWLEDKGLSVALHYRRAPQLASYAHRLARTAARSLGASHGVRRGKRVVEIGPAGRDKGTAIEAFMREPPFRGRVPVFLGDDVTDEFGFAAVNRLGGHSIKIGRGASAARWRLRDVAAVRSWLLSGHPLPTVIR